MAVGISQSSSFAPDSVKAKADAASIFVIMDRKSKIDPCDESGTRLENVKGEIELRNVSFKYPTRPDIQIFCDLSLTIHSGKSLMIASIPNIIGWFIISFAKDSSFLFMGRLLEGFGVGIISYTVVVALEEDDRNKVKMLYIALEKDDRNKDTYHEARQSYEDLGSFTPDQDAWTEVMSPNWHGRKWKTQEADRQSCSTIFA